MKALITGATSGIGRDMALVLSRMGYDLILASRNTEKMEQVKRKLPTKVSIITVDLSVEADCYRLYDTVKDQEIDILINNAGYGGYGHFWESPLAQDLNMLDLNVRAVHILTKLFLADFRQRDQGYILNVASSAGFLPGPMMSTYYASKNYVLRLTEAIFEELRRDESNVHVSALCPGPVDTDFNRRANVNFSIGGMKSMDVARYAIEKMFEKRAVILPGKLMKLTYVGEKFLSEEALLRFVYKIQHQKKGN